MEIQFILLLHEEAAIKRLFKINSNSLCPVDDLYPVPLTRSPFQPHGIVVNPNDSFDIDIFQTLVAYFPPNIVTCSLRVWLREIGFSFAYGALMLKTWR